MIELNYLNNLGDQNNIYGLVNLNNINDLSNLM